jgi:hypothetical protein
MPDHGINNLLNLNAVWNNKFVTDVLIPFVIHRFWPCQVDLGWVTIIRIVFTWHLCLTSHSSMPQAFLQNSAQRESLPFQQTHFLSWLWRSWVLYSIRCVCILQWNWNVVFLHLVNIFSIPSWPNKNCICIEIVSFITYFYCCCYTAVGCSPGGSRPYTLNCA